MNDKHYIKIYLFITIPKTCFEKVALRIRPLREEEKARGLKCVAEKVDDKVSIISHDYKIRVKDSYYDIKYYTLLMVIPKMF